MAAGFNSAMTNRSLRNIKSELEFLADASVITPQQYSTILSQLPQSGSTPRVASPQQEVPTAPLANLNLQNSNQYNEKSNGYFAPEPAAQVPPPSQDPPAYPSAPPPPASALTHAVALYAYNPTDAGDLALQPHDRIAVTEYMNAEWWKGRSERSGLEGIFPRSYVKTEEKIPQAPVHTPTNYGNAPVDVSQGGGSSAGHGKGAEYGKKFGKKMGNAAIFGAGATVGSKIVNGIF